MLAHYVLIGHLCYRNSGNSWFSGLFKQFNNYDYEDYKGIQSISIFLYRIAIQYLEKI